MMSDSDKLLVWFLGSGFLMGFGIAWLIFG